MKKIKLGLDAKRAFHNHSGLGVYSRNLIQYIELNKENIDITLFSPRSKKKIFNSKLKIINSIFGSIWRSFLIYFDLKKNKIKIYHGLAGELPFWIPNRVKTIVTIHDLLFLRFPQDYKWLDRTIYNLKARLACNKADYIIAVSQATKNEIIKYYEIPSDKILVVPVGLKIETEKKLPKPIKQDYIICISSFLPRKNQKLLIDAFISIVDQVNFNLILIGSGSQWNEVKKYAQKSKYSNRIIFIKKANDIIKFAYLSHARFSIYPSKYEGFGIPIIESMAYQIPIIVSDTSTHREVAGDAAIYFENENTNDLANKILMTSTLTELEKNIIKSKGLERVENFKSEKVNSAILKIYRDLAEE